MHLVILMLKASSNSPGLKGKGTVCPMNAVGGASLRAKELRHQGRQVGKQPGCRSKPPTQDYMVP